MSKQVILVAEDDDNDFFLLQRALQKADFRVPVLRASDGQEAVDYLSGANPFSDRVAYPFPTLLLLDLKMPLKHGFDVLRWIRQESQYPIRLLPTIVFSSTNRQEDIDRALELGANAFLTKPTTIEALAEMVTTIDAFWLKLHSWNARR